MEGEGTYSDILTVVVRTSGWPEAYWPHELQDGISIVFNPYLGTVSIVDRSTETELAMKEGLSFPRHTRQKIRITDINEAIRVYIGDSQDPVISVKVPDTAKRHYFAIYNRENMGGPKESAIDDLIVEEPTER